MDDEETTFLGLAYQEMMNGGIQLNSTKEALAATTAGFVSGDQCERRLGVDDRRRGIEALCLRQSIPSSQCTTQGVSLSSHAGRSFDKIESQRTACLDGLLYPWILVTGS